MLATCGSGFWCISDIEKTDASNFDLNEVWITDQDNVSIVVFMALDSAYAET